MKSYTINTVRKFVIHIQFLCNLFSNTFMGQPPTNSIIYIIHNSGSEKEKGTITRFIISHLINFSWNQILRCVNKTKNKISVCIVIYFLVLKNAQRHFQLFSFKLLNIFEMRLSAQRALTQIFVYSDRQDKPQGLSVYIARPSMRTKVSNPCYVTIFSLIFFMFYEFNKKICPQFLLVQNMLLF